jgi:hypothetical protein
LAHGQAAGVAQNHHERNLELPDGKVEHPFRAVACDISRDSARKYGSQGLIEDHFGGDSAVGAGDHSRNRMLLVGDPMKIVSGVEEATAMARPESSVSGQ